jgi:hypothetical protein
LGSVPLCCGRSSAELTGHRDEDNKSGHQRMGRMNELCECVKLFKINKKEVHRQPNL